MFTLYVVVTLLAAAANFYAASNDFRRVGWLLTNMDRLGVPRTWLFTLGTLKTIGAAGLLVGIWRPDVGIVAAAGLVLFFLGAIISTLRVRWYSHLPFPAIWLLLAIGALMLRLSFR
ncbi:MAG: DoxX family protein [Acidobacteriaceae bacterium]